MAKKAEQLELFPNEETQSQPTAQPINWYEFDWDNKINSIEDLKTIFKLDISKEYHIIAIRNDKDKDEFEMYNSDTIERQDWNTLVNKITK